MSSILESALMTVGLFVAMLIALEIGHRFAARTISPGTQDSKAGTGAVEGAVLALLGLLIAFTFTASAARFNRRRQMIVEEANAVGTAWLRLDLLPAEDQPALREVFQRYVDSRIALYGTLTDTNAAVSAASESQGLQREVWSQAAASAGRDGRPQVATLVLPALNQMFDIATARVNALRTHPPPLLFNMLFGLAVLAALLAGYAMAGPGGRKWLHWLLFAAAISVMFYAIRDLEYPRLGIIRVDGADWVLLETREAMR